MTIRFGPLIAMSGLVAISLACTQSPGRRDGVSWSDSQRGTRGTTIEHLTPPRDSVGVAPARFTWTPIEGADSYSVGIWSEVDMMMWRGHNIRTPAVDLPADVRLEPGTYFWSVTAFRDTRPVADSGRSAFVVR